jgi:hypothetical protein
MAATDPLAGTKSKHVLNDAAALRNAISPPPGTRFPQPADERQPFEPREPLRGKVDFADILGYHDPMDQRFKLLGAPQAGVPAAACFTIRPKDTFIDYLVRNDRFQAPGFVAGGFVLVAAIEGIADRLGLSALRLESVEHPKTREWYGRQGFIDEDEPRAEPGWGTVYPMVKRVAPFGAP